MSEFSIAVEHEIEMAARATDGSKAFGILGASVAFILLTVLVGGVLTASLAVGIGYLIWKVLQG